MKPEQRFLGQPKEFWANVRTISEMVGYTAKGTGQVKVPTKEEMVQALSASGLSSNHVINSADGALTPLGLNLLDYFAYRAKVLNEYVEPRLMDVDRARAVFDEMRKTWPPTRKIPMNKQKEEKAAYAYFTAIINMIIEAHLPDSPAISIHSNSSP